MTAVDEAKDRVVTFVATGSEEEVPSGVLLDRLPLPSFQTAEVRAWLDQYREYAIYVMAGEEVASKGVPVLRVPTTSTDYDLLLAEMPR